MKLTSTQRRALERLQEHGGEGVRMKNGCVLARGEVLTYHQNGHEEGDRLTWPVFLRLGAAGLVRIVGNRVTAL